MSMSIKYLYSVNSHWSNLRCWMGLSCGYRISMIYLAVLIQYLNSGVSRTDRQTDGRTDKQMELNECGRAIKEGVNSTRNNNKLVWSVTICLYCV